MNKSMSLNINNVLINNFNNVCRTCSQKNDLVPIHENIYLIEMLVTSAQIQIQLNDELPKNICLNCIKDLNQSYAFISKCKATDSVFRQCLTQQKLLNSKENDKTKHKVYTKNVESTEEVFIKTEISDNDDYNHNESISDECSKDSINNQAENENKNDEQKQQSNENQDNYCSDCNKSFATNTEFILHFNDCQFKNLLVPMEQEESSDDEFQDTTLDDSSTILPDKSQTSETNEASSSSTTVILPNKSKILYECCYKQFKEWHRTRNSPQITEPLLLAYFKEKALKVKAPTLWSMYSMLKTTLALGDRIDITKYEKLVPFIKTQSIGYRPQRTFSLTPQQIEQFMREADDQTYLMMKVVLIMGISGACRRAEITYMTINDVQDVGPVLIVKLHKSNKQRTFTITNPLYITLYRKYVALRPAQLVNNRLFIKYTKGRCINQVVGINTIGSIPSLIAKYLKLPNPENYKAHCFRKTSAKLFSNL